MVGERKLLVRGLGKESIEKTVVLTLVILACGFLPPPRSHLAGGQRSDKPHAGPAAGFNKEAILARAASLAVPFVRNAGRFNKQVRYSADLFSGRFFLNDQELVYSLVKYSGKKSAQPDRTGWSTMPAKNAPKKGIAFKEYFVNEKGSRIYFEPFGEEKGTTKISYFRGNDPAKWQRGLATYNCVSLGDIYPGIEVKLKASGKNVEKIFYVSPGSDAARIRIGVAGVKGLEITSDGRLLFKNSVGELAMRAPVAWQEIAGRRREVKVGYRLLGKHGYGFAIDSDYDRNQLLVIDPELDTLMASTFLGGSSSESAMALALDGSGNVYIAGSTTSTNFPTTVGAYDRMLNPIYNEDYYPDSYPDDVFVSKLDGGLTRLLASTYLGGELDPTAEIDNFDFARSLVLDGSGNVFVAGSTNSADFPTTVGAYDRIFNYEDAFVSKLNGDLTDLQASTYLGGDRSDRGTSLALDHSGNLYLAGNTYSLDFPTTSGAYDRSIINENPDAFVSRLNNNLTQLLASTYLGGSGRDYAFSLILGGSNDVFLAGTTTSKDFPTSSGAYDRTYNGDGEYFDTKSDVFVSKLNGDLSSLLASTYLGGSSYECGYSLVLNSAGSVYLTGGTWSANFPTTPGAYDRTYNGGNLEVTTLNHGDVFISKFNENLTQLQASTFLGGSDSEDGSSMALDSSENIYLTGETWSANFPTTSGAYDRINKTGRYYIGDVFVSKLDDNLTALLASTFIGGIHDDRGHGIAMDSRGDIYIAGTCAPGFPTTPGAYERTNNGSYDAFVAKLKVTVPINIDLLAERRELRAFSIVRQYGQLHFLAAGAPLGPAIRATELREGGNVQAMRKGIASPMPQESFSMYHTATVPVAQYRILRRQGGGDFKLLKEIAPSELQNGQFQMQDKYLEKDITYTYRVEANNASGQLIGISTEKTI